MTKQRGRLLFVLKGEDGLCACQDGLHMLSLLEPSTQKLIKNICLVLIIWTGAPLGSLTSCSLAEGIC